MRNTKRCIQGPGLRPQAGDARTSPIGSNGTGRGPTRFPIEALNELEYYREQTFSTQRSAVCGILTRSALRWGVGKPASCTGRTGWTGPCVSGLRTESRASRAYLGTLHCRVRCFSDPETITAGKSCHARYAEVMIPRKNAPAATHTRSGRGIKCVRNNVYLPHTS